MSLVFVLLLLTIQFTDSDKPICAFNKGDKTQLLRRNQTKYQKVSQRPELPRHEELIEHVEKFINKSEVVVLLKRKIKRNFSSHGNKYGRLNRHKSKRKRNEIKHTTYSLKLSTLLINDYIRKNTIDEYNIVPRYYKNHGSTTPKTKKMYLRRQIPGGLDPASMAGMGQAMPGFDPANAGQLAPGQDAANLGNLASTTIDPKATGEEGKAAMYTKRTPTQWTRTTPIRISLPEYCDYYAYYCLKAYVTGRVCARTLYWTYTTFKNYCMMDYVNCIERYEIWTPIHMGPCFTHDNYTDYNYYPQTNDDFLYQDHAQPYMKKK